MRDIARGQRLKLSDLLDADAALRLHLKLEAPFELDYACFGVDAAGKLSNDAYMVFFNQLASPCGSVKLNLAGGAAQFDLNLRSLPASIDKLVFTATVDGEGIMSAIKTGAATLHQGGSARGAFNFTASDFGAEKALLVAEVYRKDGNWRVAALGQGFNGGLGALLKHFGGQLADEPVPAPAPAPMPAAVPKAAPPVSLSKVTLTKPDQKHSVSLSKSAQRPGKLIVQAQWTDNGDSRSDNDDLDLRVGLLLPDGRMQLIHAPAQPGAFTAAPWVYHTGDVRSASARQPGTETVEINPDIALHSGGTVALVFSVYSAVSNGAVSVASLKPKMRMEYGDQVVECAFDFAKSKSFGVYTYVIGTAKISATDIVLAPSGQTSNRFSEATPKLAWGKNGEAVMTVNGPSVFKPG